MVYSNAETLQIQLGFFVVPYVFSQAFYFELLLFVLVKGTLSAWLKRLHIWCCKANMLDGAYRKAHKVWTKVAGFDKTSR